MQPLYKSEIERIEVLRREYTKVLGDSLIDMMIFKGFCSAPASTKYHGNYEGGLFDHSVSVAQTLLRYTHKMNLKWYHENSPLKIGILHDLCKIDNYKKNEESGLYEYVKTNLVQGHGTKSVIYALRYGCTLTEEELACILYHMGAFEQENMNMYASAVERFPNVLWTHTADMEASRILGV